TGERVVSREKPAQRLRVVEAAVEEHGERPMQALEDVVPVQERGGYAQRAVGALHGDQLAGAEQLPDPALLEAAAGSYFRGGQPIRRRNVGHTGKLVHRPPLPPPPRLTNPRQQPFTAASPARSAGQPMIHGRPASP